MSLQSHPGLPVYLTSEEAAALVRKTQKAFEMWVKRRGIVPDARAGRRRLYLAESLLTVLRRDARPWER